MFFRTVYKSGQIFLPFCHNTRVWQTDGQTDISSQYRVCITCSAVKIGSQGSIVWITWPTFKLWHPHNFSGMAADTNRKFCMRTEGKGY